MGFSSDLIYRADIRFLIMIGATMVFIFPLCLFKTLSGFRYLSLFTLFSVIYVIVVLAIELPTYLNTYYVYENINWYKLDWNFFQSFTTTIFAYSCHVELINIYDEMSEPSKTGGY